LAQKIEGLPHNYSSHPSGILIGDRKLHRNIPIKRRPDGDLVATFNKEDINELGLLKLDLLGLRNLTIIEDTLKAVYRLTGRKMEVKDIPMDDPKTFQTIACGDTLGCFQLESMGIRYLMRKMRPENLEELALLLALYRPGAWQQGIVETYLKRRGGRESIPFICSEMEPILSSTCGLIVYQEQVMEMAHVIAGYSMGQADLLRRALTKKQVATLVEQRNRFISGAVKNGHTEKSASEIFNFLENFAGYSFNKAHSISYAYISYWTVYLKTHYPKEYMASLLSLEGGYYDKSVYIREVKKMGIPLLGPDVNRSSTGFGSEKDGIRIGIDMIKGIGAQTAASLLHCRQKHGRFMCFQDFIGKMKSYRVKKPVLKALINTGACDELGNSRSQMLDLLNKSQADTFEYPLIKDLSDHFPPEVRATSRIGYVRFHGRNYRKWWHHEETHERYDYLYTQQELNDWVPRILKLSARTDKTFVSMNNHYRAQAAINGRMLRELIENVSCAKMTDESLNEVNDLETLKNICLKKFSPAPDEKLVFGEGPENAGLMLIGEAPGEEEAKTGRVFVGNAGRLLNKYLEEAEIDREIAYITNVVKIRPPGNRTPKKSEIDQAMPFLERQIQLVKPKIMVCLGSTAVKAIVDPRAKITEIRGAWIEKDSIKIMPTFHPSAVFHDEDKKELLKRDLIQAGEMLKTY